MVRILQDHLGQLRTGTGMLTRVVSSGPSPDARRSSQSTSSCWSRRTFEQAPPQRASSGSAVGRVERRGEASGACRGSATGSISLLWRPWSPVGCGVRGRPDAIASPGSLQRQPAAGTGMKRKRGWEAPRKDGRAPQQRGWTRGLVRCGVLDRGFPAHAGMDPPRTSGLRGMRTLLDNFEGLRRGSACRRERSRPQRVAVSSAACRPFHRMYRLTAPSRVATETA